MTLIATPDRTVSSTPIAGMESVAISTPLDCPGSLTPRRVRAGWRPEGRSAAWAGAAVKGSVVTKSASVIVTTIALRDTVFAPLGPRACIIVYRP